MFINFSILIFFCLINKITTTAIAARDTMAYHRNYLNADIFFWIQKQNF